MMDTNTLASAMGCSFSTAQRYVADFNVALRRANCTTVNRAAMYCAQVGHESVGLRYMEEIASGAAYEGRRDLGNIYPGDGVRYKGRGPIQLTGRHNYGEFGKWVEAIGLVEDPNYFVRNPHVVATSRWGFLAASWYWTVARPMNYYADRRDIYGASKAVNGGYNGIADRIRRWNHCLSLGAALLPSGGGGAAPPSAPDNKPSVAIYRSKEFPMRMPKGGKLKKGGATRLAYESIAIAGGALREHDLVIAAGIGPKAGVHIESINTWGYITRDKAQRRLGATVHNPGGHGALMKNAWVHRHASCSLIIPKGVTRIDVAFASDTEWSLDIEARG